MRLSAIPPLPTNRSPSQPVGTPVPECTRFAGIRVYQVAANQVAAAEAHFQALTRPTETFVAPFDTSQVDDRYAHVLMVLDGPDMVESLLDLLPNLRAAMAAMGSHKHPARFLQAFRLFLAPNPNLMAQLPPALFEYVATRSMHGTGQTKAERRRSKGKDHQGKPMAFYTVDATGTVTQNATFDYPTT